MSKAYVVFEYEVHDQDLYAKYVEVGGPSMERAGGRVVAGTARRATIAGDRTPANLVIVEFPSYEAALEWHESSEYQSIIPTRERAATSNTFIVEAL